MRGVLYKCHECNKEFDSEKGLAGHKRMHGPSEGSVSYEESEKVYIEELDKYVLKGNEERVRETIVECPECESYHQNNKFCSESCAASYNNRNRTRSVEVRKKISRSLSGIDREPQSYKIYFINCKNCGDIFVDSYSKQYAGLRICCSEECVEMLNAKGGYKNSKKSKYKGVKLDSSWELAYAKYLDENNISWTRPKQSFSYEFKGKKRRYYPDFYLVDENVYVEIKGYKTEKDEAKWRDFTEELRVLRREDLLEEGILDKEKVE